MTRANAVWTAGLVGVVALGTSVAWFAKGPVAGLQFACGAAATLFNLFGLWGLVQAMTPGQAWTPLRLAGLGALLMHLPVFIVLAKWVQRPGGPGPAAFLLGGALVYCLAVGRVLSRPS